MKCEDSGCVEPYILGARKHQHRYLELAGFRIGDQVETLDGEPAGKVSRLARVNFHIEVDTSMPGQIIPRRWRSEQLRHRQEVAG